MARKSRKSEVKPPITPSPVVTYDTALYVRLSLMDLGKTNNDTVINQEELLRNYVEEHTELSLKNVFVDNGETGVNFDRPAWNDLMRECRRGEINCIVIKDLSRLGRNYIETGDYLERVLPALGVRLIAVNDRYDSINLSNSERLVSNLKNLVNDIYAKDISRKVSAAFHTKQKKGVFIGNQAPYGYEKPQKNIIVPNPETAPIVRKIFKWKAEGFGTAKICEMLEEQGIPSPGKYNYNKGILKHPVNATGLWHRKTVKNILQNPVYLGHMAQGKAFCSLAQSIPYRKTKREEWVIIHDTHEPIVSQELYDEANAVIEARKAVYDERTGRHDRFEAPEYVLKSLVFCPDCGKTMVRGKVVAGDRNTAVWALHCATYKVQKLCTKKYIREKVLNNAVFEAVLSQLQICSDMLEVVGKLNGNADYKSRLIGYDADIEEAEKEIRRISSLRKGAFEDYAAKLLTSSEYQFAAEKYKVKIDKLCAQIETSKNAKKKYIGNTTVKNKWLATYSRFLDSNELTTEMANALIERVEVSSDKSVEVTFKFSDDFEALYRGCASWDM